MAQPNGLNPEFEGLHLKTQSLVAAGTDALADTNKINPGVVNATVTAVTTNANDWVRLPALSSVNIGHTIRIYAGAGSNFELRTPASSNEKINDVDSDGSQEYLVTDTDTVVATKISSTAWIAQSLTKLGAVRTAVIPD